MGVCASCGGMFNNYAIVQGVDHVVPVDMYLPGCPPRPEMLIDAILKLHDQVQDTKLGANRARRDRGARDRGPQRAADLRDEGPAAMTDGPEEPEDFPEVTPGTERTQDRSAAATSCRRPDRRARGRRRPARHVRRPAAPATPPATAAWSARSRCPARPPRPYGGWFDEVADALRGRPAGAGVRRASRRSSSTAARSPSTSAASDLLAVAQLLRDDERCASSSAPASRRALPRRHRPRAARGLPPAVDDPQPPDPRSRSPAPTPTRTSRRSSRSTRPTTGTSARPTTSSASSSTATPR